MYIAKLARWEREREREREGDRQTDRQANRQNGREKQRQEGWERMRRKKRSLMSLENQIRVNGDWQENRHY